MRRTCMKVAVAALMAMTIGAPAAAATIQIQLTGLDVNFNGSSLVDAGSPLGGGGDPADADPLATLDFFLDGILVGSLSSNIYADVALFGVGHIPVGGGLAQAQGGGFDLLTSSTVPGWGLALSLNNAQIFYTGGQIALSIASVDAEVFEQQLPFDLLIGGPVDVILLLGNLTSVTDNGQWLTGFNAIGTGTVSGTALPEPATLILLGAGLLGLTSRARRRR